MCLSLRETLTSAREKEAAEAVGAGAPILTTGSQAIVSLICSGCDVKPNTHLVATHPFCVLTKKL